MNTQKLKQILFVTLRKNKINEIDEATHKALCDKVTWNESRYLVFPTGIENTSFTKV